MPVGPTGKASLKAPRTVLFDPGRGGHHLKYISILLKGLRKLGHEVVIASKATTSCSTEFKLLLEKQQSEFRVIPFHDRPANGFRQKAGWGLWLSKEMGNWRGCQVFFPYADYVLFIWGLWGTILRSFGWKPPRIRGIFFDCGFAHSRPSSLRARLKEALFRIIVSRGPLERLFILDEVAYEYLQSKGATKRIVLCPDPVETPTSVSKAAARKPLRIPEEAKVIGAYGLLHEGKGIDRLVAAFLRRKPAADEWLLLMGKQSLSLKAKLRDMMGGGIGSDRIVCVDRFVSDQELEVGIQAADVVAVLYPSHMGSASFLIRAAASRRPVLASNTGWIARMMDRYHLGHTCNVFDEKCLAKGVDWAFTSPELADGGAEEFVSQNSVDSFLSVVFDGW